MESHAIAKPRGESRCALGVDNRQRDSCRREEVRDVSAVGGHDLSGAVRGKNDNRSVNDVVRLRACEESPGRVRVDLAEVGDVAASQEPT
ncbi:MAG: hypothetical protein QOD72_1321 [Acidimicrobiaceae bacterium]|nr:hypothetical protein [Acidimicrobiaceae bacterium]